MTDSLTTDTAAVLPDSLFYTAPAADSSVCAFCPVLDTAALAPWALADTAAVTETVVEVPDWHDGLEPDARPDRPASNTGFLLAISGIFVLMAFNFKHLKRLVGIYFEELTKVRRGRDNVFSDRPAADTRIMMLLVVQAVVCGAILMAGALSASAGHAMKLGGVGRESALLGAYYLLQLTAYQTVGYTFSTPEGRREWVRGFNASQALLGLALALPAVLTVFYPETVGSMFIVGIAAFILAKILFIFKGIRIFYDKISDLLYFILYLCTLEIIPIVWVYVLSLYIAV